jgi:hypothetical protein
MDRDGDFAPKFELQVSFQTEYEILAMELNMNAGWI